MDWIKNVIGGLLGSKKFVVMVGGLIITLAAKYKLNLDPDAVNKIVEVLMVWLGAQGLADWGKSAAAVK